MGREEEQADLVLERLFPKLIWPRRVKKLQRDSIRINLSGIQGCHRDADIQECLIAGMMVPGANLAVQVA